MNERTHSEKPPQRAGLGDAARHLVSRNWRPATILDVGAASGTRELYDAFPDAALVLLDPLIEHEPALRRIAATREARCLITALGPEPGNATLHVHADLDSSSVLRERDGAHLDGTPRTVPMTTLERVVAEFDPARPILAKLDVQGFELEVLRASGDLLDGEENVVILESSLFEFYRGTPLVAEVIEFMRDRSFALYDLVGQLYRPLDDALAQADLVFVHERGRLRSDQRFATPAQRTESRKAGSP